MLKVKEGTTTTSGFTLTLDEIPTEEKNYRVDVVATLENGTVLPVVSKNVKVEYLPCTKITIAGDSSITDNNNHNYTYVIGREDGKTPNIGVKSVTATKVSGVPEITVSNTASGAFTVTRSGVPTAHSVVVKVVAVLENDTTLEESITIGLKVVPTVAISGDASFIAKNGNGESEYSFVYSPSEYNVEVALSSVQVSGTGLSIANQSTSGFKVVASGLSVSGSGTITAVVNVDGTPKTITKSVTVTYQEVVEYEAVDLGLPSGTLWANMNIGASRPEDTGEYFAWGSITGYIAGEEHDFSWENAPFNGGNSSYNESAWNAVKDSIMNEQGYLLTEYDAAAKNMGGAWIMPTKNDFVELFENCSICCYNQCIKFTSKITGYTDKSILFPFCGYWKSTQIKIQYANNMWTRSRNITGNAIYAQRFYFETDGHSKEVSSMDRYVGAPIRGVLKP